MINMLSIIDNNKTIFVKKEENSSGEKNFSFLDELTKDVFMDKYEEETRKLRESSKNYKNITQDVIKIVGPKAFQGL